MKHEGIKHTNPKLHQCGLFIMKSHPYIGATPDNIFSCKCTSSCVNRFTVEYKCPDISDENHITACSKTKFLEQEDGHFRLKRNHKYYTQVIGQLALTNCKECYFIVWFQKTKPFVERIPFDHSYWAKVMRNLVIFFKSFIQEVLLGIADIRLCPRVTRYAWIKLIWTKMKEENHAGLAIYVTMSLVFRPMQNFVNFVTMPIWFWYR